MKESAFNFETKSKFIEYLLWASYYPENFYLKQLISSSPQPYIINYYNLPILEIRKPSVNLQQNF